MAMPTLFRSESREARRRILGGARHLGATSPVFWALVAIAIVIGAVLLAEFKSVLLDQARVAEQRRLEWRQPSARVAKTGATPTQVSSKIVAGTSTP
jgi:predicted metalloprotease